MHDSIGIPACFTAGTPRPADDPTPTSVIRSGQSVFMSVYSTKIASQCRLITVTWCKNLLLHGLSVSVQGQNRDEEYRCKVELKPWYCWRKQGSKQFTVDGSAVDVIWDLKAAKLNGETEPQSDYYVAIVCKKEVVLLVGDQKKDAFRKTGCQPLLIEPILVFRREHLFGKSKFLTRIKFHEKENFHEILIECSNGSDGSNPELEIKIDGIQAVRVKRLRWKFRGNDCVDVNRNRVEVFWDVHDWLFCSGPRHEVFIFKPVSAEHTVDPPSLSAVDQSLTEKVGSGVGDEHDNAGGASPLFSLFVYAWKVE